VHVHVFFNPMQHPAHPDAIYYRQLERDCPFFHVEKSVWGDAYWETLRRFDFGLSVNERIIFGEPAEEYDMGEIAVCGSSRIADYVATGLGAIVTPGLRLQSLIARHYAPVCVEADRAFLENPRPALCAALRARRNRPLHALTCSGVAPRLDAFYRSFGRAATVCDAA
jgi:hypothetical protein